MSIPEPANDPIPHQVALAQPTGIKHRVYGPERYRGWALKIDTIDLKTQAAIYAGDLGPHYAKRWTLGQGFLGCFAHFLAFHVTGRAPDALKGERVIKMRLVHIDPDHPQPDPPL